MRAHDLPGRGTIAMQTLRKPGSSRATAFMHPSPQDAVTGCPLLDLKSQWAGRYMLCMKRLLSASATSPGESSGFQPGAAETCAVAVAPRKAGCDQPPGNFQFLSARCWPLQSIAKRPVRQCASVSVRSRQGSKAANKGAYMDVSDRNLQPQLTQ